MAQVHAKLFYEYKTSDELLAHLEMEKDDLQDSILAMKEEVDAVEKEAVRLVFGAAFKRQLKVNQR